MTLHRKDAIAFRSIDLYQEFKLSFTGPSIEGLLIEGLVMRLVSAMWVRWETRTCQRIKSYKNLAGPCS
jgi:hypothetical protein